MNLPADCPHGRARIQKLEFRLVDEIDLKISMSKRQGNFHSLAVAKCSNCKHESVKQRRVMCRGSCGKRKSTGLETTISETQVGWNLMKRGTKRR